MFRMHDDYLSPRMFVGASRNGFMSNPGKLTYALPQDYVGDLRPPVIYQPVESAWYIPGPTALIDVYTPNENTTGTLVVDDPSHVIAACDTPGDNDWFAVTLTAGETYEFGQYAYAGGIPGSEGNGAPLADAYLEIYDSSGNLLGIADGGGPNTPSGLDALMTFEAPYSGTFYVNATSYDNDGDGIGDFAGDYEIFARTAIGNVYTSEYDISSPLHSIDWGGVRVNREHVAVENPDGAEGPRPTGDAAADPADVEGNALGFPGKNVIYLYFAGEGDLYAHQDSTIPAQVVVQDPYQYEVQAMLNAANEFSKVADVVFVSNYTLNPTTHLYERDPTIEYKPGPLGPQAGIDYAAGVDDGFDADFFYFSYPGTPGPGISLLGSMNPPDTGDEGVAQFNSADERWTAQMLQPGGFSFTTLIHEFGHGMGLAHPHDTGGGSSVMPGVDPLTPGDDGGKGTYGLNQQIYTMMSYNDGWEESPYGQAETNNEGYGWLGSLMALDIAVIQDKYGVNEEWATGNDTYVLKDANQWGVYIDSATGQPAEHGPDDAATSRDGYYQGQSTSYRSIWDAGGIDEISYVGTKNTVIDLRAATLQYETPGRGGGGYMSYAFGIHGGFTIANGVTIENATSGSGDDTLVGNAVNNHLDGGAGNDLFNLSVGGVDTAIGGTGNDVFSFGGAYTIADIVQGGLGSDRLALGGLYNSGVVFNAATFSSVETITALTAGGAGYNSYNLTVGNAILAAGQLLTVDASGLARGETLMLYGSGELDGSFYVLGGANRDIINTGEANDTIRGGLGSDIINGNGGIDTFRYFALEELTGDRVDGGAGTDTMLLNGAFNAGAVLGATLMTNVERIRLSSAGADDHFSYNLTMNNGNVAAGQMLTVDGSDLLRGETMMFYGQAELDGRFTIIGGANNDYLNGGQGNDRIQGGLARDTMNGYGGADTFAYSSALESTGTAYDRILSFDFSSDRLDMAGNHDTYTRKTTGALSTATFNTDMGAAMAGVLNPNGAVLFTASSGDLAGHLFLAVDQNGVAGYQEGQDFVIEFVNSPLPAVIPDFII